MVTGMECGHRMSISSVQRYGYTIECGYVDTASTAASPVSDINAGQEMTSIFICRLKMPVRKRLNCYFR